MRCESENCKQKILSIGIQCKYCSKKFCAKHRIPEDHHCPGLEELRKSENMKNETNLMENKTVANKVTAF